MRHNNASDKRADNPNPQIVLLVVIAVISVLVAVFIDEINIQFKVPDPRLWVGVETVELTSQIKRQFDIQSANGLLVSRVFVGSPAQVSGIMEGDIIRRWGGVSVTSQDKFQNLIQTSDPRTRVKITVDRNGVPVTVYCNVGRRPGGL